MLLLLRMKTAYLQKLPWLLAGLAHTCEQTSREIGQRVLDQWAQDPRPEAHHRITSELLCPGPFMDSLRKWVGGAELQDLSKTFLMHVAAWRFAPVVETAIEEKHARVALAKRRHHIGPVRISLANRLPLLERWMKRGHVSAQELLHFFNDCRSLKTIPSLLNLANHPAIEDDFFRRPAKMRVSLARIMYRCDLQNMYASHDTFAREHDKLKRKAMHRELKLLDREAVGALTHETLLRSAMQSHMLLLHNDEGEGACFYTCPSTCLNLQSVSAALTEPLSKRPRVEAQLPQVEDLLPPDVDVCEAPASTITFQIVMKNPADKKVIRPAVGAGGRLGKGAVVVSHKVLCSKDVLTDDSALVSGPSAAMDDVGGQFLLSGLLGNIDEMQTCMRRWNAVDLAWTLQSSSTFGFEHGQLHELLQGLVAAGAYEMNEASLGYTALPEQVPVLETLELHGLVTKAGAEHFRWYFTDLGARELCSCSALSRPSRVFRVREELPLADRSTFELLLALTDEHWEWQRWVPTSKRTRRMAAAGQTFDPYTRGSRKVFYSGESPSHSYLLLLLKAEEYFDDGLPAIQHGREEACYKAILKGDFQSMMPQLQDLPPEIEALEEAAPEPVGGIGDVLQELAAGDPAGPVGEEAAALDDEAGDDILAELERLMEDDQVDVPVQAAVDPPSNDELSSDSGAAEPAPAAGHRQRRRRDRDRPEPIAAAAADAGPLLENGFFGHFRLTVKRAGQGGKFGGVQATCVYHKKSESTGCKRFLSLESATEEAKDKSLRRLAWWCTMAPDFDRQRKHLVAPLPFESCPPWSYLNAKVAVMPAPDAGAVQTGVQLDAAAAAAPGPKAKAKAKNSETQTKG